MPTSIIQKTKHKALDKVCPKKKRRTKIKANPWYNKQLKALADKVKKANKSSKRLLGESKVYYKSLNIKSYVNREEGPLEKI